MLNSLTPKAVRVIMMANIEATRSGGVVGAEHLFIAMLRSSDEKVLGILQKFDVSIAYSRVKIQEVLKTKPPEIYSDMGIKFSRPVAEIIHRAGILSDAQIEPIHLLRAFSEQAYAETVLSVFSIPLRDLKHLLLS